MKNKILLLAATGGIALLSTAQADLIAGWDFSQFVGSGFNSTNGSDFTGEGNAQANYSDFNTPSPDIAAATYGSIYYNGEFGSTDVADGFTFGVAPFTGNLESNNVQATDLSPFNDLGSYALLTHSGQTSVNNLNLGVDQNISVVFEANVIGQWSGGYDWTLSFAAMDYLNTSSVSWEISTDGANYSSLGVTSNFTTTDTGYSVTSSLANGSDQVFFRGTFADIDPGTSRVMLDNVGISSAVPEPSTYAAIFGAIALAFAASRRRRA